MNDSETSKASSQEGVEIWLRAIDRAPHDTNCACGTLMNVDEFYPCSCWKADLL